MSVVVYAHCINRYLRCLIIYVYLHLLETGTSFPKYWGANPIFSPFTKTYIANPFGQPAGWPAGWLAGWLACWLAVTVLCHQCVMFCL